MTHRQKALELIGPARPIVFDISLYSKAENKRYTLEDYSDAHWIFQLLYYYKNTGFALTRAACEMILNAFINTGIVKAKELEQQLNPILPINWIKIDNGNWDETRNELLKRKKMIVDGD